MSLPVRGTYLLFMMEVHDMTTSGRNTASATAQNGDTDSDERPGSDKGEYERFKTAKD